MKINLNTKLENTVLFKVKYAVFFSAQFKIITHSEIIAKQLIKKVL